MRNRAPGRIVSLVSSDSPPRTETEPTMNTTTTLFALRNRRACIESAAATLGITISPRGECVADVEAVVEAGAMLLCGEGVETARAHAFAASEPRAPHSSDWV